MLSGIFRWLCALLLVGVLMSMRTSLLDAADNANGITSPVSGATLRGSVEIKGVATHPSFRKWQLDLVIGDHATFIALGEKPLREEGVFTTLDTTRYPNGAHQLRLRVVRDGLNYDEYMLSIVIDNPGGAPPLVPLPQSGQDNPIRQVPSLDKVIYLTFDDGPSEYTTQILDVLARYHAKATFFVVGKLAKAQPKLIQRIVADGDTIGNHTYDHRSLRGLKAAVFAKEVQDTHDAIGDLETHCLRPPYGNTDANTVKYAAKLGYTVALWSVDPKDWLRPGAQAIARHVIAHAFSGAVVVLHDGGGNRAQTVAAVDTILHTLSGRGYRFEVLCK